MQRLRISVLLLCILPILSGCFLWSSSDKGPKPTPLTDIQSSIDLKVLWHERASSLNDAVLRPAVVGDSVYAAGQDGALVRLDNGKETWRIKAARTLSGGVASDGSIVVVGSATGELLAFNADKGNQRWHVDVGGEVVGAPLIVNGMVIVRVGDNQLLAYDQADGKRRWIYQRVQAPLSLRSYSGFARSNDLLLAGFSGGKLMALTLSGGFPRWEATVALPRGSNELERMADVVGDPALQGDSVCVAAFQGRVACVDKNNGVVLWTRDIPSSVGVDVDDKFVYVTDDAGAVYALDISTGGTAWKQDKLLYRGVGRPLAIGNYVAVGDAQGWVHLLDKRDGRFAARVRLDSSGVAAPLAKLTTGFVAQTRDGSVYALAMH
ncbi:MAG TPA: outer membrane protein assembly factor BamB [Rhodocyclaceae bacterium]|nr:outer membrane protein assembly factor BamB [Rhodocyclaceae bacterium]